MPYATSADVQEYTGIDILPEGIDRLLKRAEELIDTASMDRIDSEEPEHLEAAKKATCAQIEYWLTTDEQEDIAGPVQGYSIGSLQVQFGAGDNRISPTYVAPRARRYLFLAGLMYRGVRMQ